jgi:hypothetical protein
MPNVSGMYRDIPAGKDKKAAGGYRLLRNKKFTEPGKARFRVSIIIIIIIIIIIVLLLYCSILLHIINYLTDVSDVSSYMQLFLKKIV